MDASILSKKKRIIFYLPYLGAFCFIAEVVSVAIWDAYSRKALHGTRDSLAILNLNIDTKVVWGAEALAFTVALVIIMALAMLALGAGRSVIAYQADRTGATRMGGRLMAWMWLDAIFVGCWFLLTLWLLLLLLGQCLWMAACWGLNTSIKVGTSSALANNGTNTTIYHNDTASTCYSACVDLSSFEWALGNDTCFCTLGVVDEADAAMQAAMGELGGAVVGAVMLLITGMWILMASAAEFGVTRRERQLLRRIAKARAAQQNTENAKLLPNGGGSTFGLGKKSKDKSSKGTLSKPEAVIVDQETGEVLDVDEPTPLGRTAPSSGAAGGSSLKRAGSIARMARGVTKSTGKAFEVMKKRMFAGSAPLWL